MTDENYLLLVVDDNQLNRDSLSRILTRQGYQVATAENGQIALDMMQSQSFDLVLLDIMMPVMNGYEVLKHLKADPKMRHIPVIVVSANEEIESVVQCIELGAEDYLPKPFNRVLLKSRVGASLERKRLYDQEQKYLQAVRQELETGRQIQADFLPFELPQLTKLELATCFRPAREVSGDFFDAFTLPGNRVALIIADVCDKGVGAALFMSLTRSLIRVLAQQAALRLQPFGLEAERHFVQLPETRTQPSLLISTLTLEILNAVKLTNDYITANHSRTSMFATLFFGVLELEAGIFSYVNAGHEAPLVLGAGKIKTRLKNTGPAVGVMPKINYGIRQLKFETGDTLLAYTDGVIDALSPDKIQFGEKQLLAIAEECAGTDAFTASGLLAHLDQQVQVFIAGGEPADDITILTAQYLP